MKAPLVVLFFTLTRLLSIAQVERVEPPFWWAGMMHEEVQVLLHGENLSDCDITVRGSGVKLIRSERVPNSNYLFIYLDLKHAMPGTVEFQLRADNGESMIYNWSLLKRRDDSAERTGFGNEDVMYLITPDRFCNGDPQNDNVEGMLERANREDKCGRHGGDLAGIKNRLSYIKDMGFTAVWLNPILENNMPKYSYHGYAITDHYKVDPRYGTNEEYVELVQEAKNEGVKVIMDMIMNHCGSGHWLISDLPDTTWIHHASGPYFETSHRRLINQDIHASEYDKRRFSNGWFVPTMPDLNQSNDLVADYLIQNSIWWIEYADLSGIRMDTYPYADKTFMSDWSCAILTEYPYFNIVGEEWSLEPSVISYWQGEKSNHDGYSSCLPSLMDFPIQDALVKALVQEEDKYSSGLIKLYEKLALDFVYPNAGDLVVFPDNHDIDRFFTLLEEDIDLLKMGMAFILTVRGTPQLYYGTEILLENSDDLSHCGLRMDFPGGWPNDEISGFSGQGLDDDAIQVQSYLRQLLNWRQDSEAIKYGSMKHFAPENGVYAYFRIKDDNKVAVFLNKNDKVVELDLSRFKEVIEPGMKSTDVINRTDLLLTDQLHLGPRSATILDIRS